MHRIIAWIDLVLFIALIAVGLWVVRGHPWSLDAPSAASLAGALFGGAAVLLGNWINRSNERHKSAMELGKKSATLKAMIAAELVNLTAGLLDSKRIMDAGITSLKAGGGGVGQLDMSQYLPRHMPFTESLGVELLTLETPAVDALATLLLNLAQTRQSMESHAEIVKATFGLSMTTATSLSNGLAHDMTVLAEVFEHVAPTRKLKLPGEQQPELVTEILKKAAKPPYVPVQ